jgi:putative ABC transport system permease protein
MARVETAAPEGTTVVGVKTREASVVYGGEEVRGRVKSVERPRTLLTATRGEIPRTWRSGAVVGATLARQEGIGVGDSLRIDGDLYRVRAVLESETNLLSPDYAVFVPPNRLGPGYDSALVRADDTETAFAAATRLDDRLNAGRDRYHVRDFESSVRRIRRQKAQIDTFLLGVGAISMFVAGVSILNVMLMSVMERRQEIGVLRAVGYHRFDVLRLVVGEAALLGVVGALLGAVVSLAVGLLIHDVMLGDPTAFTAASVRYLAIGVGFGLATSVVSGLYPAWKAANAHPVEALRE